jgi:hypothetical protein
MTLVELRALGVGEMPFHTYKHPIRPVAEVEYEALFAEGLIPRGFWESSVQMFEALQAPTWRSGSPDYRRLRFELFDAYGTYCAFTRRSYSNLWGTRYGIDVGHLWPNWAGGPAIIQNALPMSKDVNNQWDEGMISLRGNGDVLISHQAGDDTRWLFDKVKRIDFPLNAALWPYAKYLERHRDEIFEKGPDRLRRPGPI